MSNIVYQYLYWYFIEQTRAIFLAWKNFLSFTLNYFSVPLLLKTFCSPWRRYRYFYPKPFDFKKWVDAFTFNLISRFMGMLMRTILIIFGLIAEFFVFLSGILLLIIWIFLPIILLIFLIYGFKLILF